MTTIYVDNIAPNLQSKISAPNLTLPTGSVIQVKQAFKSDTGTGAASAFTDIGGMSVTITPSSASSKFLVMYSASITMYNLTLQVRLMRDSTAIGVGNAGGVRTQSNAGFLNASSDTNHQAPKVTGSFLDTPNTTSAITYKLQFKTQSGQTAYFNRSSSDHDNTDWTHRSTSDITVMEIAG